MTQSIESKVFLTSDEMNEIHRNHRKIALKEYDSHFDDRFDTHFRGFQIDLDKSIDE